MNKPVDNGSVVVNEWTEARERGRTAAKGERNPYHLGTHLYDCWWDGAIDAAIANSQRPAPERG